MVFASAGASGGAPAGAGDGVGGERRRDEDYRPAEAGTGNSRTSKSERTVGHRAVAVREHDSSAMTTLLPSVTAGTTWGKITVPVTGKTPPEPSRLPTTPAGSVTETTSGVDIDACSPAGLDPEQSASCCCQEGIVKNGQTSATPWAWPVLSKVAKTPSDPAGGMPLRGGLGSLAG